MLIKFIKSFFKKKRKSKFEVFRDKGREWRFNLKALNGEIIASSEGYSSKQACLQGIESVKRNAPRASIEDKL